MTINRTILTEIDSYLNDDLSLDEKQAFEARLSKDKELSEMVEDVRRANQTVRYARLSELRNKIGEDIKEIDSKPSIPFKKKHAIALTVFLLTGVAYFLVSNNTDLQTEISNKTEITPTRKSSDERFSPHETVEESYKEKSYTEEKTVTVNEVLPKVQSFIEEPIVTSDSGSMDSSNSNLKEIEEERIDTTKIVSTTIIDTSIAQKERCEEKITLKPTSTCQGKADAVINIHTTLSDWEVYVNDEGFGSNLTTIDDLEKGEYLLKIAYASTCSFIQTVHIKEKWCPLNEDFGFNPDLGQTWEFKYDEEAQGVCIIYDKFGKEVFNQALNAGIDEWDGRDKQGAIVPSETYIAVIQYHDGRKEKIELVIIR